MTETLQNFDFFSFLAPDTFKILNFEYSSIKQIATTQEA